MAGTIRPSISKENMVLAEQFFGQVSESIQLVFDLTSRIDERVKMLIARQNEIDDRVEKLIEIHQNTINRLGIVESKEYPQLKEDIVRIKENINSIAALNEDVKEVKEKLRNLEVKEQLMTIRMGSHDNHWTLVFDAVWKLGLMLIAGYILYKLGLTPPPVP